MFWQNISCGRNELYAGQPAFEHGQGSFKSVLYQGLHEQTNGCSLRCHKHAALHYRKDAALLHI